MTDARRIDVHAHFLPDYYQAILANAGIVHPDGMPEVPRWSEAAALETMDELGVATAMLSISSPGVHFGDGAAARDLARRCNDTGAELARRRRDRFGVFAALPLPDIDGAIAEVAHAFDVLGTDGICMETNHHGLYPGDDRLEPLYRELNRRGAIVFLHPTSPSCTGCDALALGYPRPMLEFMFETTRCVSQMILSGVTQRHPDIRFIVPHAGATLPVLASRIEAQIPMYSQNATAPDFKGEMRKFHYDLAGAPLPELLAALREIVAVDKLLYGSDWPFTSRAGAVELARKLDTTPLLDARDRHAAMLGNALKLFPRLTKAEGENSSADPSANDLRRN